MTDDQLACAAASSANNSFTAVRTEVLKFMKEAEVVVMHNKRAHYRLKKRSLEESTLGHGRNVPSH